jgi:hypothetical protein
VREKSVCARSGRTSIDRFTKKKKNFRIKPSSTNKIVHNKAPMCFLVSNVEENKKEKRNKENGKWKRVFSQ